MEIRELRAFVAVAEEGGMSAAARCLHVSQSTLSMVMKAETAQDRSKRRHQRILFDSVAELYDATRLQYPSEVVEFMVTSAEVAAGSTVLDLSFGTASSARAWLGSGST
jgi:hypothetical protein